MASGFDIGKDFTITSHKPSGTHGYDASGSSAQYTLGSDWGHPNDDYTTISETFATAGNPGSYDTVNWVIDGCGTLMENEFTSTDSANNFLVLGGCCPVTDRSFKTVNKVGRYVDISFRFIAGEYEPFATYPDGADLSKPGSGHNMYIQYSTDGSSWTTHKTFEASVYNSDAAGMPAWTSYTAVIDFGAPSFFRFSQLLAACDGNWGVDDITLKHHATLPGEYFDVLGGNGRVDTSRRKEAHAPFFIQDSPIARLHVRSEGRTAKGYKSTIG
tara:strand:- start:194 stop:1009 length:816 start_codon:yes stop_codon:yes gene_type:complete